MADTITVSATVRIEAPIETVRAQYRDIDHHMRTNVHPDITFHWEPAAPGERKVRSTFKILGVPQFDVAFLEDQPDGTFVIRYVEGTNAGMVVHHEYHPAGEGTEVRVTARAPATLGRTLLGPLFKLGALHVIKKAMAEDKADLEGGRYRIGRSAANLARVLGELDSVAGRPDPKAAEAVLRAACIVSAADASMHEAEQDALRTIAGKLGVDPSAPEASVKELAASTAFAAEAREAGAALAKHGVAREGLLAAAAVALASEGMSLGELAALRAIAAGARFPDDQVGALVEHVDGTLGA